MKFLPVLCFTAAVLAGCSASEPDAAPPAAAIVRHSSGSFPIASAVEVPSGYTLVFHSGTVPSPADEKAAEGTPAYWGDTKTQSLSVLNKIKSSVEGLGMTMADVVSMTVYLAADKSTNPQARMDFDGFMEAYRQFYGEAASQPDLPARSTVEVANLVSPGMLVEIEVTLARHASGD
jgi:enamine deaminase RidA (YjgF/YER057c/UK114 family)